MKKYLTNGLGISLCENCWCMTHSYISGDTGKEICMKCGGKKDKREVKNGRRKNEEND